MNYFSKNQRILRKFGYKSDQDGIIKRYMRERDAWDIHLNNTKNYILESAQKRTKNTAVILGSGWLLDIPIDELSEIFQTVYLVDIIHPRQIQHKIRNLQNIITIETDLTGLLEHVFEFIKTFDSKKNTILLTDLNAKISNFGLPENVKPDFVVSVNLLNQLDILLTDYLRKTKKFDNQEILNFQKKIQHHHLEMLPVGKTCLITDYEEELYENEKLIGVKPLVYTDLPKNSTQKLWKWHFDSHYTYNPDYMTVFNVVAINY